MVGPLHPISKETLEPKEMPPEAVTLQPVHCVSCHFPQGPSSPTHGPSEQHLCVCTHRA